MTKKEFLNRIFLYGFVFSSPNWYRHPLDLALCINKKEGAYIYFNLPRGKGKRKLFITLSLAEMDEKIQELMQ